MASEETLLKVPCC